MKKSLFIIDWLLILTFILMVLSKFITMPFTKIIQPIFLGLILIHIIQHWKILVFSLKNFRKK
jgi:hypothetical protein